MKGNRAVLTAVVVLVVVVVGWWLFGRGSRAGGADLIEQFAQTEKRPPDLFAVKEVALAGETKRAVSVCAAAGTRLIWKVTVPDDGWLWVSVGMDPSVWEKEGDGVKFLVGVSDGRAFESLFEQHLNPFANPADRKWIPVRVDLSSYAGEQVDVIFNTFSSPSGGGDDRRNDLALWGTPEIVVR